jgi:tetratricopeptide (TPR) repeat protein
MSEHLISIEEANENLLACAAYLAEDIKSADGHAEALKNIVPMYLEKGEVDLAAELADRVEDPFTRDKLLSAIAEKCAAIDDDEYALQLSEAIEDYGIQGEAVERIAIQKVVKGDFEKALQTAETLSHPDNVYADIALQMASSGNLQKAEEMLENIEFSTAKANALENIARLFLDKKQNKEAVEVLEKAFKATQEIDYETDEIRILTEVGNLFTQAKRQDRAIETLAKAKQIAEKMDSVHREYLLSGVSLGFFQAGSLDLADRTLDLIKDKTHLASTLVGFAREFWAKDEKNEANEALEEAYQILKSQEEMETRDTKVKLALWRTIALQFASFEREERAIEVAQEIIDDNEQMTALAQIAQVAILKKKDDFADQAIRAIPEEAERMFAFIGISDAKNQIEERENAINYLNEAFQLAETVPQFASRSTAYNEIANRFVEYGEGTRAREVSHENLETITQIKDESIRAVALANLSQIYENAEFMLTDAEKQLLSSMMRKADW